MIKKLLLTLSFIALATIAFSGITYAAQEGETIVISEELSKLHKLYIEGDITEEEFSKAKSILLDPDSDLSKEQKKKKKKVWFKKQKKVTAAERKQLENELIEAEQALKEQLRAEKKAERERIKQARIDEKKRIIEEREKACADDPKGKGCKSAKLQLTKILEKIKIKSIEDSEKAKEERAQEKQASLEEKERNKAERAARKAERERIKQARIDEKKRIIEEREKACADDPKGKGCKSAKLQLTKILEKIKIKSIEDSEKAKEERAQRAARKAEREIIKQARIDKRKRIIEGWKKPCTDDPKGCKSAKLQLTKILEKIKIKSIEDSEKAKEERAQEKQAIEERKKRIAKQRELERQASLEEKEKNKAEKAARKTERKRRKAEWKKACSDDPESKACKEGKASEKIKNVLKKIEKKLGG